MIVLVVVMMMMMMMILVHRLVGPIGMDVDTEEMVLRTNPLS
jgi:cytochrome b subunit of formate dehydrogenase